VTILPIKTFGAPVLREPTARIERFDDDLVRLAEDMLETMYDAPGVGLAATQVGMSLRFFVFDDGEHEPGAIANAEIVSLEGEEEIDEGCLSVPGLWFPVRRATKVRLAGVDLNGDPIEIEAEGLRARIMQHETDHVDGILYLDRLSDEHRRAAMQQLRERDLNGAPGRSSVR
jgi:peptide deformylase